MNRLRLQCELLKRKVLLLCCQYLPCLESAAMHPTERMGHPRVWGLAVGCVVWIHVIDLPGVEACRRQFRCDSTILRFVAEPNIRQFADLRGISQLARLRESRNGR